MILEITLLMIFAIFTVAFVRKIIIVNISYYTIGFFLVLIAALRDPDPDYYNYVYAFKYGSERMEPIIQLIIYLLKYFSNNYIYFFIIIAIISVITKIIGLKILTKYYLLSLLLYLSHFFILYDLIQIRAAAAAGIMLLSIKPLYERKFKLYILVVTIAICFHYSAIVFFIFLIFNVRHIRQYIYLIPSVYIIAIIGYTLTNFIVYIPFEPIQVLFQMYKTVNVGSITPQVNIFNILQIARSVLCLFMIMRIDKMAIDCEYSIILVKIYALACSFFILFSDIAVIAFRLSDLLMIVEVVLIPIFVFSFFKKTFYSKLVIVFISVAFFMGSIFYLKLFDLAK